MSVDVLVGMQFGSEGKGKVASILADYYAASVRVGAPNAGHTVVEHGKKYVMRHIPSACINHKCRLFIGPAGMVNMKVLAEELQGLPSDVVDRLRIDGHAMVISDKHIQKERDEKMNAHIGSTSEGVGAALKEKIGRLDCKLARDYSALVPYITDTALEVNRLLENGQRVLIEGTQGTGLSLNHSHYPYCTSRDVIASTLLGDCGIAPYYVRHVIGVMRTYPIRVAGNSGPMSAPEITWDDVQKRSGRTEPIKEITTVTKRVRRVSEISFDELRRAVMLNRPSVLFITFLDYINGKDYKVNDRSKLSEEAHAFVETVEKETGVPVVGASTGPDVEDTVWFCDPNKLFR